MTQIPLLGGPGDEQTLSPAQSSGQARVLITVKAAPHPSAAYGETVCVAGLRLDLERGSWIRLYPINFRSLDDEKAFKKYDIVTLRVERHNRSGDTRPESWRPVSDSIETQAHLGTGSAWKQRRALIDPFVIDNACDLNRAAEVDSRAQSLGAVRPVDIDRFVVAIHPGWSADERAKIDRYVNQLTLFGGEDRTPLEAPRYRGMYRYRCPAPRCRGHEQSLIDWEFVAFQRRHLRGIGDAEAKQRLIEKFYEELCGSSRDTVFFLGNQAKRRQTFSVLGVFWPPLRRS